jgi:hypothetical protein
MERTSWHSNLQNLLLKTVVHEMSVLVSGLALAYCLAIA